MCGVGGNLYFIVNNLAKYSTMLGWSLANLASNNYCSGVVTGFGHSSLCHKKLVF